MLQVWLVIYMTPFCIASLICSTILQARARTCNESADGIWKVSHISVAVQTWSTVLLLASADYASRHAKCID